MILFNISIRYRFLLQIHNRLEVDYILNVVSIDGFLVELSLDHVKSEFAEVMTSQDEIPVTELGNSRPMFVLFLHISSLLRNVSY